MDTLLAQVMNRDPAVVRPATSLAAAAAAMRQHGAGSAAVTDDGGTVVGILTERDVARAAAAGVDPATAAVQGWMTPRPFTMAPADRLSSALARMLDRDVRHIPVCEGPALVGMVSLRRLVRAGGAGVPGPATAPAAPPGAAPARAGLEDVRVGSTRLSEIDGIRGRLRYAGYDAAALAEQRTVEDVWHLLHHGALPADDAFARRMATLRRVPLKSATLRAIARAGATPMAAAQAAVAATGAALGLQPWHERDRAAVAEEALRLAAVTPTLVAALHRLAQGARPVPPDPRLGHVANYLWMATGRRPARAAVQIASRYAVLTADHGMNASTFTARVVASTGADVAAAVAAAMGALSGPLHGGAPSLVLDMLDAIGEPARARAWVRDAVARGRRVMGFGHRVYRAEDPRAASLRATALALGGPRVALAREVEREALAALRAAKPDRALFTNVEFWSAVALEAAGLPRTLFTPTFAVARVVGWTAHVLEQIGDNRLIRPDAAYVGPAARPLP